MYLLLLLILFSFQIPVFGQNISGIETRFREDPSEWVLYRDSLKEEEIGTIRLRWEDRIDIWDFEIGDISGSIRMKWKENPNIWEVRTDRNNVLVQTTWKDDFSSWVLPYGGDYNIRYRIRYSNDPEEWITEDSEDYGFFSQWTDVEGDLNSWSTNNALIKGKVPIETRIMLCFLPIWINIYRP